MTTNATAGTMPTIETPPPPTTPQRRKVVVCGEQLLAKVRELIHQGDVRRIVVIGEDGASILEIPLTAGVIGAIVAPVLVAIGAIAALAKNYTLLIEATSPSSSVKPRNGAGGRPNSGGPARALKSARRVKVR